MTKSKIIIIEGPQGVGKTTITDYLRYAMKYTNLYRLAGTSDSSLKGLEKSRKMYKSLLTYMKSLENLDINLLFDRTFFTEEVYCRLGFKEYSFDELYNELIDELSNLDFEIYYITLYLKDEKMYLERLQREDKAITNYAKYSSESSIIQQKIYLDVADELKQKCSNINVYKIDTSKNLEVTKKELKKIIGF